VQFKSFDGEYVKRLVDRDPATETHFVNYFSGLLALKLRRSLHSGQEVEDLSQEVFLRVLRNLRSGLVLQSPERLGAYVLTTCRNVLLEHFRGQLRFTQIDQDAPEPLQRGLSAEQLLLNEESRSRIHKIMETLSAKDRGILNALFLEEREKDAVCLDYGVGRDYLRVLLHRAKNRFRQQLENPGDSRANGATNSGD